MEKLILEQAQEDRIIRHESAFKRRLRLAKSEKVAEKLKKFELVPTPYFYEALDYGRRAAILQQANLDGKRRKVGDKLQEAIPIYDTTRRRYAGFSNVLEQLWYGTKAPKYQANKARGFVQDAGTWRLLSKDRPLCWMFLCLAHRITGSGASFEWDHGFRNSRILEAAMRHTPGQMARFLGEYDGPIFTSIGNQIPPFPPMGGRAYLVQVAPKLVKKTYLWLMGSKTRKTIQEAVDGVLDIHSELGCKRFKFVLTAWVMDIAEYLPYLVDPNSDCYHGKNSEATMKICFHKPRGMKLQDFNDRGTRLIAECTDTYPMDVEDVFCDFVRWIENYVPKKGFDHVHEQNIFNSNSLVWNEGRQPLPF